ncbi:MAG: UDP-N-acetylmuramoyl-tripeptide--D-alanyl-D-alanine ligase [Alistipes senegalensis]|nr:UDP-N-acetylmuramoyl-tripeptide--D-alanyl-D-alanine ligase [Oxalobacter formigenes]MCM1280584.1 UDP-N-acetylmuramoyl-tripeptide--D-alanyl-D-alanine ligase [Alistipes senegalensis]
MKAALKDVAAWVQGSRMQQDAVFDGVSTDSRTAPAGSLFVALKGEHFDAHDFLPGLPEKEVAAVVAERVPEGFPLPVLVVEDTRRALGEMAVQWRRRFALPVIGVTGSNGKTTVKEMIASVFRAAYGEGGFLATAGNLNNDIGVPQTLFRLEAGQKAAVIELGMNHPGEMAGLAAMAQPTVGLVNNAQREHQEFMASVRAVAEENGGVIRALPEDGTAVFPAEADFSGLWEQYAKESGKRKIVTFGFGGTASVRGRYDPADGRLEIQVGGRAAVARLAVMGVHNAHNALAAAACCHAVGIGMEDMVRGLEAFRPVRGRLQRRQAANGALLIDDTYNANPDSVRAAIDVLAQASFPRVLVLGDMGEVGSQGIPFHEEVGAYAREKGIDCFFTLGDLARYAARAYGEKAVHFGGAEELLRYLREWMPPSATALVKGSRFMKMERIVNGLIERG